MTTIHCSKCGRAFAGQGSQDRAASISGSIMGDEYIESYYFCDQCGVYTREVYHDSFMGEGTASVQGTLPKAEGDAKVALIRKCSKPWSKNCRCRAHRAYFGNSLD